MTTARAACQWCGIIHATNTPDAYVCFPCQLSIRDTRQPTDDDELTGGYWYQDGLVRRWRWAA